MIGMVDVFFALVGLGCKHKRISWPLTHPNGKTYVSCLNCGREMEHTLLVPNPKNWRWVNEQRSRPKLAD